MLHRGGEAVKKRRGKAPERMAMLLQSPLSMVKRDTASQTAEASSNTIKNPEDWTTGNEPMTGAQRSYLKTLSEEAKVEFDEALTKAEASKRIDELQGQTGRGQNSQGA